MRASVIILLVAGLLATPKTGAQQAPNPFGAGAMGGQGMAGRALGGLPGQQPQMPLMPQQRELTNADRAVMRNFSQSNWLNATISAGARRYNLSKSGRSITYKITQGQQVIMDGKVPTESLFIEPEETTTTDEDLDSGAPSVEAGPGVTLRPLTGYRYERVSLSDGTSMVDRVPYDWQALEKAKEADIAYYEMMYTMNPPSGAGGFGGGMVGAGGYGAAGYGAAGYGGAGTWQTGRAMGAAGMATQGAQFRAGQTYPAQAGGGYPGAVGGYPGAVGGYPGAVGGYPGAGGGYPGAGGGYPGAGGGYPGAGGGYPGAGGFGMEYQQPGFGGGYPGAEAMAGAGGFGMEYQAGAGYPMEGTLGYDGLTGPGAGLEGEGTARQLAEWYYAVQQLRLWEQYVQRIIGRRDTGSKLPAAAQELPGRFAGLHNEYLSERGEAEEAEYMALLDLFDNIHKRRVARENYMLFKEEQMEFVGEQITEWRRQDAGQVLVRDGVTYVRSEEPIKQLDVESVNVVTPRFSPYHILNEDGTTKSELDAMR